MPEGGKYINFKKASEYSGYCEEYLRRKARQGVLKAEKQGRVWQTKQEWLNEFLERKERRKVVLPEKALSQYDPEKSPAFSVQKEHFLFNKKRFAFVALILILISVFSLLSFLNKSPFNFLAGILHYLK